MKVSKFLASTAATAAVVGAIGFAYAQTSSDPATSGSAINNPPAMSDTRSPSSSSAPAENSPTSPAPDERAARADRG